MSQKGAPGWRRVNPGRREGGDLPLELAGWLTVPGLAGPFITNQSPSTSPPVASPPPAPTRHARACGGEVRAKRSTRQGGGHTRAAAAAATLLTICSIAAAAPAGSMLAAAGCWPKTGA
eukprot:364866-Chlamydomonas_euryale.AAC.5